MNVLKFDVYGDLAHFRKPYSNMSRLTYKLPPKMTIAGMLSATIGLERDSYYDIFTEDKFKIAIQPLDQISTTRIPQNVVGTADSDMDTINNRGNGPALKLLNPKSYKQRIYQYIMKPKYRIYMTLDDETQYQIYDYLTTNRSVYTQTLGSSNCISNINNVEKVQSEPMIKECNVSTPVTNQASVSEISGKNIITEKITGGFEIAGGSRGTEKRISSSYISYLYDKNGTGLTVEPEDDQDIYYIPSEKTYIELY